MTISRRRFLAIGAGAAIALPLFESLRPRHARALPGDPPRRLIFWYVPNGIHMPAWTPVADGAGYPFSPILAPLVEPGWPDLRPQVSVLTGLKNDPARPDGIGDHASGTGAFLTVRHVRKTEGADIQNGISVDQVAAAAQAGATRFASLELGLDAGASVGGCEAGYSCAYSSNISWAGPSTPMPKTVTPRALFDRMFSGFDPNASVAELERRRRYATSVLDHGVGAAQSLKLRLGRSDQLKLDEYLTAVRTVEQRISEPAPLCNPGAPPGPGLGFHDTTESMSDLMVIALRCDQTRVITFMQGDAGSQRAYPYLGITDGHHELSHHRDDEGKITMLQTINHWEVGRFASLVRKLAAVHEDGVSLLDSSAVFFSSELEDGDAHGHSNLPVLLAGRCGGAFTPGRHLRYPGVTIANLYLAMLAAVDAPQATFGDDGTEALIGL